MSDPDLKPGGETPGKFDLFSDKAAAVYAKSYAFIVAVVMVVVWAAFGPAMQFKDTWHLIINTPTTIVTFLGVFVIQNQQFRGDRAINKKLNAIADGVADLMEEHGGMADHIRELREAVGLEKREST